MKQSESRCPAQGLARADVCRFPFPGNSSEWCPNKGKKHRAPSPTLEPRCPGSNPASTAPSGATSDEVSDLSAPQIPQPQKEGNDILTWRTLARMKVLRAGLAHRKLSGCVAAIITIITDPTSDAYTAHSPQVPPGFRVRYFPRSWGQAGCVWAPCPCDDYTQRQWRWVSSGPNSVAFG